MHLVSGCVSAVSVAPMRDETNEAAGAARASFLRGVTPLVRTHRARLLALARGQGLAAEDALDCVQDALSAFLQSAEALALARCPEEAGRVLCARVVHAAQNQRRWLARRAPAADTDALARASITTVANVLRAEFRLDAQALTAAAAQYKEQENG